MADAKTAVPLQNNLQIVRLAGRIDSRRQNKNVNGVTFITLLALPALDRFSHPDTVEVVSSENLGELGAEVSIVCRVGGYPRKVTPKDEDRKPYRTADNVLRFVEFG
jgi:hypothetical protein